MDKFAPFVMWVYASTGVLLGAYLSYLFLGLRRERRLERSETDREERR